jgi:hypothetical protein
MKAMTNSKMMSNKPQNIGHEGGENANQQFPPDYLNSLEAVFDFSIFDSMLDVGGNPNLIATVRSKYPLIKSSHIIVDDVVRRQTASEGHDLSDDLRNAEPAFDLVNCNLGDSDSHFVDGVIINNLCRLAKDIMIISFAEGGNIDALINHAKDNGFGFWTSATESLKSQLENDFSQIKLFVAVFKRKKFADIYGDYYIQGTSTDNVNHHTFFAKPGLYRQGLQNAFMRLKTMICSASNEGRALSILRLGDGDYFFLRKMPVGSAKPGRRALTTSYDNLDIKAFKRSFWSSDVVSPEIDAVNHRQWLKYIFYDFFDNALWKVKINFRGQSSSLLFQMMFDRTFGRLVQSRAFLEIFTKIFRRNNLIYPKTRLKDIIDKQYLPMESVYALIGTRWLFRNYPGSIALIGGKEKVELVKKLVGHEEYRRYLGIERFADYIEVPQIGAADNLEKLIKDIGGQVAKSKAEVFLIGAGSSKLGFLTELKKYKTAVFIDVGCGIDALAGIVSQDRPYFADWVNYRLSGFDYSTIDFMDQGKSLAKDSPYKIIYLD